MEIKAFIFDIDGVLVESEQANYHSLNRALQHFFNCSITLDDDKEMGPVPTYLKLEILANRFGFSYTDEIKKEFLAKKYEFLIDEINNCQTVYNKDAKTFFEFLKSKGIKTALVSNARSEYISFVISLLGINDFVDFSIGNDYKLKAKPNPDMYVFAMETLNVSPKATVIFEDSDVGLKAATGSLANVVHVKNFEMLTTNLVKEIYESAHQFNFDFPAS